MMDRLFKSDFAKNVFTMMTGAGLAQLVPILLTPVLTRLFSPEEFGIYAFYMSLITFFAVIASGRYEQAIILPKEDADAINVLGLSFTLLIVFSLLLTGLFFFGFTPISQLIDTPALDDWLLFLPLCVFSVAAYRIMTLWSNRKSRFNISARAIFIQTLGRAGTQLIGGLIKMSAFSVGVFAFFKVMFNESYMLPSGMSTIGLTALILSYFAGFFIGFLFLIWPFIKFDRNILGAITWSSMKVQAKIFVKFPKINSLHAMGDELKNIGVNSTILFVFNDVILGFYSMTFRVLRAPLTVIGSSFGQVFYQRAAELHANNQDFRGLMKATVKKLAIIALPIFLVLLVFGPDLFAIVLGQKWRVAGVYTQYLTPWLFLNFVISPIQQVAIILNKQGQIFLFSLVGNALIFGSIFLGGVYFNDITKGFVLLSVLQVFYYLYLYLWLNSIAKAAINGKDL
jgi:O-antigen/teichoic acid export membrane protein